MSIRASRLSFMHSLYRYLLHLLRGAFRRSRAAPGGTPAFQIAAFMREWWLPHLRGLLIGAGILIPASLLSLVPAFLTISFIDQVLLPRHSELFVPIIAAWIAAVFIERALHFCGEAWFFRLQQRFTYDLQHQLFDRVLHFPKTFFDLHRVGELASRLLEDTAELKQFLSSGFAGLFESACRVLFAFLLLFWLEWRLALLVVFGLLSVLVLLSLFSPRLETAARRELQEQARTQADLHESISAIRLVKALGSETTMLDRLLRRVGHLLRAQRDMTVLFETAQLSHSLLLSLSLGISITIGGRLVMQGFWSVGSLLAFLYAVRAATGPIETLASARLQFSRALAATSRVSSLFDVLQEADDTRPASSVTTAPPGASSSLAPALKLKGEIRACDLCFAYRGGEAVLRSVSFVIAAGAQVGICGPSGVGKTTLLSLLLRFYQPDSGLLLFDERPISEYRARDLRQRIGYVPQIPVLISGTIIENVRFGNAEATESEINSVARELGIDAWIHSLPRGYATPVNEGGANFSEGQKQRLGLIRALVRNPDILILDEPGAMLDGIASHQILHCLSSSQRRRTTLIVTHDPVWLAHTDTVLWFSEPGRIIQDSHQNLLAAHPLYCGTLGISDGRMSR